MKMLALPLFLLMAIGAAFGIGLWISALMVRYRDFRFIVPFLVQFGLYISPVGFTSEVVPSSGGCCIRSIRWSVSSTGFAGRSLPARPRLHWPGFWYRSPWSC